MKQVTYTSKNGDVVFIWTSSSAMIKFQGDVVQSWNSYNRDTVPSPSNFDRVAENFINEYNAVVDRLKVKYPKNFFDEEWKRIVKDKG